MHHCTFASCCFLSHCCPYTLSSCLLSPAFPPFHSHASTCSFCADRFNLPQPSLAAISGAVCRPAYHLPATFPAPIHTALVARNPPQKEIPPTAVVLLLSAYFSYPSMPDEQAEQERETPPFLAPFPPCFHISLFLSHKSTPCGSFTRSHGSPNCDGMGW